jgi:hypothetical protein
MRKGFLDSFFDKGLVFFLPFFTELGEELPEFFFVYSSSYRGFI